MHMQTHIPLQFVGWMRLLVAVSARPRKTSGSNPPRSSRTRGSYGDFSNIVEVRGCVCLLEV